MTKRTIVYPMTHIQRIPGYDNLRLAEVGPYHVVTGPHYDEGQLGAYIPEGSIVPDDVLEEMWLKGKLAGSQKNRVKARKMGGVMSDGLFYGSQGKHWRQEWKEGDDVTDAFGVIPPKDE